MSLETKRDPREGLFDPGVPQRDRFYAVKMAFYLHGFRGPYRSLVWEEPPRHIDVRYSLRLREWIMFVANTETRKVGGSGRVNSLAELLAYRVPKDDATLSQLVALAEGKKTIITELD